MKKIRKIILILAFAALMMACSTLGFSRDDSGKLLVETNLPLDLIVRIIENSVEFTQVSDLQIELQEGSVFITAGAVTVGGDVYEDVSINLELFVVNGRLSARLTQVNLVGEEIDENFFTPFNQLLTERLAESQGEMEIMERAELVDVRVSPDGITLVWRLK